MNLMAPKSERQLKTILSEQIGTFYFSIDLDAQSSQSFWVSVGRNPCVDVVVNDELIIKELNNELESRRVFSLSKEDDHVDSSNYQQLKRYTQANDDEKKEHYGRGKFLRDQEEAFRIIEHHYFHRFCQSIDTEDHNFNDTIMLDYCENLVDKEWICFCGESFNSRFWSEGKFYEHLMIHATESYQCPLCLDHFSTDFDQHREHLEQIDRIETGSDVMNYLLQDSYLMLKRWCDNFFKFTIHRQLIFHHQNGLQCDRCRMCGLNKQFYGLVPAPKFPLTNEDDEKDSLMKIIDHQCKHLVYYRYVCLICYNKYDRKNRKDLYEEMKQIRFQTYDECVILDEIEEFELNYLTFPCKELIEKHIEKRHRSTFNNLDDETIIFKRWMNIGIFESNLQKSYSEFYKFNEEKRIYRKVDIQNILMIESETERMEVSIDWEQLEAFLGDMIENNPNEDEEINVDDNQKESVDGSTMSIDERIEKFFEENYDSFETIFSKFENLMIDRLMQMFRKIQTGIKQSDDKQKLLLLQVIIHNSILIANNLQKYREEIFSDESLASTDQEERNSTIFSDYHLPHDAGKILQQLWVFLRKKFSQILLRFAMTVEEFRRSLFEHTLRPVEEIYIEMNSSAEESFPQSIEIDCDDENEIDELEQNEIKFSQFFTDDKTDLNEENHSDSGISLSSNSSPINIDLLKAQDIDSYKNELSPCNRILMEKYFNPQTLQFEIERVIKNEINRQPQLINDLQHSEECSDLKQRKANELKIDSIDNLLESNDGDKLKFSSNNSNVNSSEYSQSDDIVCEEEPKPIVSSTMDAIERFLQKNVWHDNLIDRELDKECELDVAYILDFKSPQNYLPKELCNFSDHYDVNRTYGNSDIFSNKSFPLFDSQFDMTKIEQSRRSDTSSTSSTRSDIGNLYLNDISQDQLNSIFDPETSLLLSSLQQLQEGEKKYPNTIHHYPNHNQHDGGEKCSFLSSTSSSVSPSATSFCSSVVNKLKTNFPTLKNFDDQKRSESFKIFSIIDPPQTIEQITSEENLIKKMSKPKILQFEEMSKTNKIQKFIENVVVKPTGLSK
ncbi:hypothetical protein NH340_JMT08350 [Sarcoptes scabiei]|nr:hypothetical protein NH340_JMT08350 [Sarcoptes scabiei]